MEEHLKARTLLILAALMLLPQLLSAAPVQVRFQTADSANLVWMIDQMSQWDSRRTSSAYFQYWREKIGLDEYDLDMLDKYARVRRRIEAQATTVKGFEVPLFGSPDIGPGEKYFLAFLEIPRPDQAINSLPINDQDKKTLFEVISHFGKKIGTQGGWGQEIAHLRGFQQQAAILSSLADTAGFLTMVRDFLGVVDLPQVLTVDALWAPPGSRFVKPAIVGFHIILPLPVSSVKNDEEVVRQISVAMAECVRYMISRLPAQVRQQASSMVLTRVGFPNPTNSSLMLDATAVAIGQILFPLNRFPSLKQELVLAKNDPALRYPYAVDLLSRALASQVAGFLMRPGSFLAYLDTAVRVQASYFPPTPLDFTGSCIVWSADESWDYFRSVFRGFNQQHFTPKQAKEVQRAFQGSGNPMFMLVTAKERGELDKLFKRLGVAKNAMPDLKRLESVQGMIIPVILSPDAGPALIVYGADLEMIKRGLIQLHRYTALPMKPVLVN